MPTPDQLKQFRANLGAHQDLMSRQRKNADPQESAQWTVWTVDPTRCAVSGADLTPADCGSGVGGAASEPLYEEFRATQGAPEIVVTDEMVEAGIDVCEAGATDHAVIYRAMIAAAPGQRSEAVVTKAMLEAAVAFEDALIEGLLPEYYCPQLYRAMAAIAPKSTADNWWSMQWQKSQDRIAALEAENTRLLSSATCKGLVNKDLEAALVALEAEHAKLRADPVELYRADERKIDALEAEVKEWERAWAGERDFWMKQAGADLESATRRELSDNLIIELQKRIISLHAENTTLRTRAGERDASALQALRRRV